MTEEQFNYAMERIRKKDRNALKEIYEEYVGYVYNVALSLVKQKEAAEDITSELFIRLWEKAEQYKPGNGHKGYIATIARNMTIDYIRKNNKEILLEDNEDGSDGFEISSDEVTPEEEVISKLNVNEALMSLKPIYREIVNMKVLLNMTFKEISEVLNIPIGTITWDYSDAMKKLRRFGYNE